MKEKLPFASSENGNRRIFTLRDTIKNIGTKLRKKYKAVGLQLRDCQRFGLECESGRKLECQDYTMDWFEFCLRNLALDRSLIDEVIDRVARTFPTAKRDLIDIHQRSPLLSAKNEARVRLAALSASKNRPNFVVTDFDQEAQTQIEIFVYTLLQLFKNKNMDEGYTDWLNENGIVQPSIVAQRESFKNLRDQIPEGIPSPSGGRYLAFYVPEKEPTSEKEDDEFRTELSNYFFVLDEEITNELMNTLWSDEAFSKLRRLLVAGYMDMQQVKYYKKLKKFYDEIAAYKDAWIRDQLDQLEVRLNKEIWQCLEKNLEIGKTIEITWIQKQEECTKTTVFTFEWNAKTVIDIIVHIGKSQHKVRLVKKYNQEAAFEWYFKNSDCIVGYDRNDELLVNTLNAGQLIVNDLFSRFLFINPEEFTDVQTTLETLRQWVAQIPLYTDLNIMAQEVLSYLLNQVDEHEQAFEVHYLSAVVPSDIRSKIRHTRNIASRRDPVEYEVN